MGAGKPTLGYASRTEAAKALRAQGLKHREIAERLGVGPSSVSGLFTERGRAAARRHRDLEGILLATQAGQVEHRSTEPAPTRLVELHLSDADFARLVEAARSDGATPAAMARKLVLGMLSVREGV
jgi:transcriptional regulator with XRE-family HTH domain